MYGFGAAIQKVSESEIEKRALEQKDKKSLWLLDVIQHPGAIVNTISTTAIFLSILAGYVGVRAITPYAVSYTHLFFFLLFPVQLCGRYGFRNKLFLLRRSVNLR